MAYHMRILGPTVLVLCSSSHDHGSPGQFGHRLEEQLAAWRSFAQLNVSAASGEAVICKIQTRTKDLTQIVVKQLNFDFGLPNA